ncbi:hypothetical protein [Chloracidobacterium thermophilum]|uniref:hypothetical protein n=1 Tax=Chloracidobacterium thermophilum TaxID=458033 RepID=UPI001F516FF4|nr:hypothetical protein [Chloracidobacterium thermophilum]
MPRRQAFKTDSSFFRMLAAGVVGARAVQQHLNSLGHDVVELERGALSTRIWRSVKRKRVRIPDLFCTRCGVRIESRAKTKTELSMSHSSGEAERAWHYGMLDSDWVAFPILSADESVWSAGRLHKQRSLWRERHLTTWKVEDWKNLFTVQSLKQVTPKQLKPKGISEGAEIQVQWKARFASDSGCVIGVNEKHLEYRLDNNPGRRRRFNLAWDERPFLATGTAFSVTRYLPVGSNP